MSKDLAAWQVRVVSLDRLDIVLAVRVMDGHGGFGPLDDKVNSIFVLMVDVIGPLDRFKELLLLRLELANCVVFAPALAAETFV